MSRRRYTRMLSREGAAANSPLRPTEEQVAAAQLRLVLDEKLGRTTPEIVREIANYRPDEATQSPAAPQPVHHDTPAWRLGMSSASGRAMEALGRLLFPQSEGDFREQEYETRLRDRGFVIITDPDDPLLARYRHQRGEPD